MRGCLQLAVDSSGDVFVGGLALATLSGATGAEIRRTPSARAYPCQVALDRAGDLLATFSSPSGSSGVVKPGQTGVSSGEGRPHR